MQEERLRLRALRVGALPILNHFIARMGLAEELTLALKNAGYADARQRPPLCGCEHHAGLAASWPVGVAGFEPATPSFRATRRRYARLSHPTPVPAATPWSGYPVANAPAVPRKSGR
jgi:hypothetical protein